MAQIFRPANTPLDIAGLLPADFEESSRLAMQVLKSVEGLFVVDRMSWRPKMDNAVVYLVLNDQRPIFSDMVAGLAILRPDGASGKVRLGFTREPATDSLLGLWNEHPPIVRKRAWPNPIQDLEHQHLDAAKRALKTYQIS